jgi:hypothetical protein
MKESRFKEGVDPTLGEPVAVAEVAKKYGIQRRHDLSPRKGLGLIKPIDVKQTATS